MRPLKCLIAMLLLNNSANVFANTTGDWPSYNNTLEGTRFATQTEITPANVVRLGPVCTYDLGSEVSFQTGPIAVDGVIYLTTAYDTLAIDAGNCTLKWRTTEDYKPAGPLVVNRGAAVADGRVFRGTQDGRVLAYDAATGTRLWATTIASASMGESVPAALITWHGLVFAGNAGGDNKGVKGRIYALDADTGKVSWRFKAPAPILAGVTATAGGLVFTGDVAGNLYAFDARSGARLWQTATGSAIGGGIISFASPNGAQRITVATGRISPLWPGARVRARLVVYGLQK